MKNLLITFAVLLLATSAAQAELKFGGEVYSVGWEAKTNNSTIKEYFRGNETTNTWKKLLTLQAHPGASKVKEVCEPFFKARTSLILIRQKIHPKKKDDFSDVVVEFFLGVPGKTTHLEFVLARFVESDSGVYMVVYSHRQPLGKKKNQDVNVDDITKNKDALIRELLEMPVESIKQQF